MVRATAWILGFFGLVLPALAIDIEPGSHICLVGGTVAERMQHYGWLEARLHSRFPDHKLVFRNLAYSGDEIGGFREFQQRLRSMDFGSHDQWLYANAPCPQLGKLGPRDQGKYRENRFELINTRPDIIFAFFGYNESRAGMKGLEKFKNDADAFVKHTLGQKYNGKAPPQLVLFSPIAHEFIDDPNFPSQKEVVESNNLIMAYSIALKGVADANEVPFIDIFGSTAGRRSVGKTLTINGIHQNEMGDSLIAAAAESQLFPDGPKIKRDAEALEKLRQAVNAKNFYWFHRYRTTDGFSTYGDRAFLKFAEGSGGYGNGLSNYTVMQRELEILDVMTSNRDQVVWAAAKGEGMKPNDENIPEIVPVISNLPGPDEGKHLFLSGEESISQMTVHKGMKVELFADEEMFKELANPVQMAFDTKGRLWVAVWPSYPHWNPINPMDDKLLILEDTNGDGKADICKTFVTGIQNPTGFEFWNGGVFLAQGPDLLFLKDLDGDDKCDSIERVVHGLDTADTHHTANSFTIDPGGALYFQEGTFHHTQVETQWGKPRRVANGAVFRYEARTQKFDVHVSFGFANPHGHAFDRWAEEIVYDGTGSQPYHALLFSGDLDFPDKHGAPPQIYQQRTRPCSGIEILSSSHFPEEHRGNLLVNNVIGVRGILQYKLQENGSSHGATELEPIVTSNDEKFRPADVEVGPDGAIYFIDWQNPIIGHMQHNLRDPSRDKLHGRVYRVRYEGRDLLKPEPIAGSTLAQLLDLLKSKDDRVRHLARIELSGRPTKEVIAAASVWLENIPADDPDREHHLMEGLWLHQSHNVVNLDLLKANLDSPDYHARAAATTTLTYWRDRVPEPLELFRARVNDEHPRVRLHAIWGLSYFHGADAEKAAEVVVESLIHDQDQYIKHQLGETTKTLDRRIARHKAEQN